MVSNPLNTFFIGSSGAYAELGRGGLHGGPGVSPAGVKGAVLLAGVWGQSPCMWEIFQN